MSNNFIGDFGAKALSKALPLCKLIELELSGTQIGEIGVNSIGEGLSKCKLVILYLKNNEINDEATKLLNYFWKSERYIEIYLNDN